jgi:hypothetical protein
LGDTARGRKEEGRNGGRRCALKGKRESKCAGKTIPNNPYPYLSTGSLTEHGFVQSIAGSAKHRPKAGPTGAADPSSGCKRAAGTPPPSQPGAKREVSGEGLAPESDELDDHDVLVVGGLGPHLL